MFGFLRKKPPEIQFLLTNISKAINNLPDDLLSLGKPLLEQLENIVKHKWKPEHEQNYAMQVQQGQRPAPGIKQTDGLMPGALGVCRYWSRKLRILRDRLGCFSLRSAFASI